MLRVFLGEFGQFTLDLAGAFLLFGREIGARFAKVGQGFCDVAVLGGGERLCLALLAVGFECFPKSFIERDAGEELAHFGQHLVVGRAQFGAVGD